MTRNWIFFYAFILVCVAFIAALGGAVTGGAITYNFLQRITPSPAISIPAPTEPAI